MSNEQHTKDFSGLAALSICESLLLALNDCKILSDHGHHRSDARWPTLDAKLMVSRAPTPPSTVLGEA